MAEYRLNQGGGVVVADDAGLPVKFASDAAGTSGLATEETLQEAVTELQTAVPELPPRPLRTDVASFPTRTLISVAGADTDQLLAAGGSGVRQFVYFGWLQTDIATVLTFKSATNAISAEVSLGAGDILDIGHLSAEIPELWTAANEALNLTKSTAATIKGVLYSRASA